MRPWLSLQLIVHCLLKSNMNLTDQTVMRSCYKPGKILYNARWEPRGGRGYSHTLPIRVCAAQRGRDFEAPDLERGIHFRGVF